MAAIDYVHASPLNTRCGQGEPYRNCGGRFQKPRVRVVLVQFDRRPNSRRFDDQCILQQLDAACTQEFRNKLSQAAMDVRQKRLILAEDPRDLPDGFAVLIARYVSPVGNRLSDAIEGIRYANQRPCADHAAQHQPSVILEEGLLV